MQEKAFARRLRGAMTRTEVLLWQAIRGQALGYKFRRQVPLAGYVVDFLCIEKRLILELDGSQHVESAHDRLRDRRLEEAGYTVLRFWNQELDANLPAVLEHIRQTAESLPSHSRRPTTACPP